MEIWLVRSFTAHEILFLICLSLVDLEHSCDYWFRCRLFRSGRDLLALSSRHMPLPTCLLVSTSFSQARLLLLRDGTISDERGEGASRLRTPGRSMRGVWRLPQSHVADYKRLLVQMSDVTGGATTAGFYLKFAGGTGATLVKRYPSATC